MRNIRQKQYSQFPPVHDFGKPWWGVAYVPCMTNLRALYAWVIQWHVNGMLSLAQHWQGRRALSNHVCAHSVIPKWRVVCLQQLARACSEHSRLTSALPINHVIQMPQCLSGFVNHDYCVHQMPRRSPGTSRQPYFHHPKHLTVYQLMWLMPYELSTVYGIDQRYIYIDKSFVIHTYVEWV